MLWERKKPQNAFKIHHHSNQIQFPSVSPKRMVYGNMCCHWNEPPVTLFGKQSNVYTKIDSHTYRILSSSHKVGKEMREKKERILQSVAHLQKFSLERFSLSSIFYSLLCLVLCISAVAFGGMLLFDLEMWQSWVKHAFII